MSTQFDSHFDSDLESRLGDLIANEYALGHPTRIRPLQTGRNRTYEVSTRHGRFALRVRGGGDWWIRDDSEFLFELDLLDHLAALNVPVSTAVARINGERIGLLQDHEGSRSYSLFTWAPGRTGSRTPDGARLVGEALARIHVAADEFRTDLSRYQLDEATMLNRRLPAIHQGFAADSAEDVRTIRTHIADIRRALRDFDPGPGGWGIIHGDVQQLNFHITQGQVTFFDFELCAWGWRAADVAEFYTRIPPTHREPFLDGYQAVRPLNPSERDMLLTIARLAWIREGCRSKNLAQMLRDPFIRFELDENNHWQMRSPT